MKFSRIISRDLFEPTRPLGDKRLVVDREQGTISARVYSFGQNYSTNDKIKAPRNVNVDAAHIGDADDIEPGFKVGNLAMHIMHAGDTLTAAQAAEWYNKTDTAIARGRYSVDDEGVRFDGTLFDDIDDAKLERLTASAPSGDWRWKAGSMIRKPQDMERTPCDFVGACMVNVPGFSPTYSQSPMTPMRLVASAESDEMLVIDQSLTAAGDGLTSQDVESAWYEQNRAPQVSAGASDSSVAESDSWVNTVYITPPSVIVCTAGEYYRASYAVDDTGEITFGVPSPVEQEWVPSVEDTKNLTAAGGEGTCGDGTCCGGECKGGKEAVDQEQLDAAIALVAANAEALGLDEAAVASLTAASNADTAGSATDIAALRADVDALAQIVYDAILSI